jgi:uncharacterized protein YjbI with pentapeptide repeats
VSPSAIRARRRGAVTAVIRGALVSLAAVGLVGVLVLLLGPIAHWATVGVDNLRGKEKADAVSATRQILLAGAAGTAVLIGLGFTARTYYLSRRGQFTDRYTKAIAQLASDKLTERLGGIYALEHLMRESEADHITVIDVLAAFIRENAPASPPSTRGDPNTTRPSDPPTPATRKAEPRPCTDIQAALTVLARRPKRPEPIWYIDLSNTDLRGADLRWARLDHTRLEQTWLQHANLSSAHLEGAFLREAQLQHAWLVETQMQDADLIDAQLEHANLGGVHLRTGDLRRVQLRQAHLRRAELQHAFLSGACLQGAYLVDAQLQNAQLAGESIRNEDLDGAQLQDANLAGAQLQGAKSCHNLVWQAGASSWRDRRTAHGGESRRDHQAAR